MRFSKSGSIASGVTSRPVKPVPPVLMTTSTAGSAIHCRTRARIFSTSSVTMARSATAGPAFSMRSTNLAPGWSPARARVSDTVNTAIFSGTNCLLLSMPGMRRPCLQLRRGERVAGADRARLEAGHEPALALRRAAVGEAVRHHVALRPSLQGIVADRRRGLHGGLDVARLDERRLALALQVVVLELRPHAGETIGLHLDPHLDGVRLGLAAGRLLQLLCLRQDAEQVLHVMADLVRDHVSLRELAGAALATAETGLDLLEELGVEIDLLIDRAVE